MTDDETPLESANPRPNPRPSPPVADNEPSIARPTPTRRQVGAPRPTPRPAVPATPRGGRGIGPALTSASDGADQPTVAAEVTISERVLVGAGGLVEPTESVSVFALDDGEPTIDLIDLDETGDWTRVPRRSGWMRRALIVLVVLGIVVGVAGVSTARWLHTQVHPAGPHGPVVAFTIEQGQPTNTVANSLAAKHVIANATVFRYWLRRQGGEQTFKAGDYDLFERMDYPELLVVLRSGPKPPVQIKVTVPPGLTIVQMQKVLLEKLPGFDATELVEALRRRELDPSYAQPPFGIREGLFFPDTFNIDEDASKSEYALLKRMRDQMDKVLKELNTETRAKALGYGVYDILKIASLIEEEAKLDADRPKIARVIYNRLAKNTPLGIDASTRYAVGKTNGEALTLTDLASDSAYNTRKAAGLPPTPISAPGRKSIEAALSPTQNEAWLYYVLTDEGGVKGAHTFANTASEFEVAKKICQQKGYCD